MKLSAFSCLLFTMLAFNLSAQTFKKANPKDIALFPQQNEYRNRLDLSGIWKFKKDSTHIGEKEKWFEGLKDYRSIAVPGSWNEQFADSRDYLDMVWYETESYIPSGWKGQKIFVRIGSANYMAKVWINGVPVGEHEGGHLPFAFEISKNVKWDASNRVTIQVENVLKHDRVPTGGPQATGMFNPYPKANFDFFPYAGLNRAVWLYTVPSSSYVKDITIVPNFAGSNGSLSVLVEQDGKANKGTVTVAGNGQKIEVPVEFRDGSATALVKIPKVRLWSLEDPFLYKVSVSISEGAKLVDRYETETGVRTISTTAKQLLLNGKPVYLKGFGKHEDFPIYGRGAAQPVMVKDYSLMKWIGANSFRTSHYPYDEEYMNMADREGFLVIDEIPAVGLFFEGDTVALNRRKSVCRQYINELLLRDKNHPSVIMWSVANEPFPAKASLTGGGEVEGDWKKAGTEFLGDLIKQTKNQDPTRLVTLIGVMAGPTDWLALSDVVCVNRYWGWYTNAGEIAAGASAFNAELNRLYRVLQKPIVVTEFGADTFPGVHAEQPEMFSEEYQKEFIKAYLDVADTKDFITGMQVWAFSDFKTGQATIRMGGINYKGIFTRDRKPKMAAHYLRSRWVTDPKKD